MSEQRSIPSASQAGSTAAHAAELFQADGLPLPRRYWAIAAIVLALSMSVLDSSIANIALPTIARQFQASSAASIWVINAYQIAILVALLPLSAVGESVGYRRVSQCGLAVFTLASLACAIAPSLLALTCARVVQGLGAAGIMSVSPALVRFTYPQRLLGRAVGINAFAVASSAAVGPTIASAVLAVANWRWLFAINGPIGIATLAIALYALPAGERSARRVNYGSAALHVGTFGLLMSGLQAFAHHAASALALAEIAGAALLGAWLTARERKQPQPLLPFDLLRLRLFSLSLATSVCCFVAQTMALVALPFEIQRIGYTAVQTGLLMTPWALAVAVSAPIAGRLADHYPAGILGSVGLAILAGGLFLVGSFPHGGGAADFVWRVAVCGLGFGLFQSPNNRAIVLSAPRARSGAAGGMLASARLLGQATGAAGVALLFRAHAVQGSHVALHVAAALALVAALVSMTRLSAAQVST